MICQVLENLKAKYMIGFYICCSFFSPVIFIFLLFLGIYANEVERKEK